jgi:Protein of unknown function (DUF559)
MRINVLVQPERSTKAQAEKPSGATEIQGAWLKSDQTVQASSYRSPGDGSGAGVQAREAAQSDQGRVAELLDRHRVLYEVEKIFLNGDRWILVDFYLKVRMLAIELDGSVHDNQKEYDRGRDEWLLRQYGVRTVRLSNSAVLDRENQGLMDCLGVARSR